MTVNTSECAVIVVNRRGLHARAAAKVATLAERFTAELVVSFEDQSVSARSILGLMMLGAGQNAQLQLAATGPDAAAALAALHTLITSGFNEDI